uniref:NADH:ubiquinone reductase (H(+)-translocating) n=1 Tax=Dracunculus medinensis TaxID=318479 RepID=A0A346G5R7_DRAME|nr:NADH dehydrogenase subunit 5 [Dracunculus medinensis]AXN91677.1 NADH dehydrogenase subunit 5 [Dracunculus medinensis]QXN59207.1 NADH dehydrogenase subunit 5 [Dracunculus medinensis]QXN59265.1 NADH dehydrogenase subunit 5 [Dracunculus medinensis]QXN59273.1 NADH dehydrogenase subunit 5 [Dracunculus medinensis]
MDVYIYWFGVILLCFLLLFVFFYDDFVFGLDFSSLELLQFQFRLDWFSFSFFCLLVMVVGSVVVYSGFYMMEDYNFNYFCVVLSIFVFSMVGVVFSNNCISMLIFWDLLGVSSYFLVLYYGNWDSCSGSMNTVMMNRVGDVCVFLVFCGLFFMGIDFISLELVVSVALFFFILSTFTKSAQYPFSSWLPKAMSAPTPVSALVHSSTLVTAGLFLGMCFSEVMFLDFVLDFMFFVGLFTMFSSGLMAYFEFDIKKLVALSTLSQIGFCFFGLGLGLVYFSFIHMLSHAVFKSCLFMQMGYIIHLCGGQQDSRGYVGVGGLSSVVYIQTFVSLMCLCGLFFLGGSVSKEILLEHYFFCNWSLFLVFLFFFSILLTYLYCYRLMKGFYYYCSSSLFYSGGSLVFSFVSLVLVVFSIVFLWWLNYNSFVISSSLLYSDYYSLFYLFVLGLVLCVVFFKFGSFDVKYKFYGDLLPKVIIRGNYVVKWSDCMVDYSIMKFGDFSFYVSKIFVMGFSGKEINFLFLCLFLLLMI